MKRIAFLHHGNNPILLDDFKAIQSLLGDEYSFNVINARSLTKAKLAEMAVEEYTAIISSIPYAALHNSGKDRLDAMKELMQRIEPGRFYLQTADVQLRMNPSLWNGPNSNSINKENPYLLTPIKVLCSFHENLLSDPLAQRRINGKWLSFLHPQSEVIPLEFTAGLVHFLPDRLNSLGANGGLVDPYFNIESFYYGIDKKFLKSSLSSLGLGASDKDAVWGTIANSFPEVRDYSRELREKRIMEHWAPLVKAARSNLLPYEPLKGEYQFTRRMLELAILNPESIVIDPKINDYVSEFLSVKRWEEKAAEVSVILKEMLG